MAFPECETVQIHDPDNPDDHMIINKDEYDHAKHTLWQAFVSGEEGSSSSGVRAQPVLIDEVRYESISAAMRALGLSRSEINDMVTAGMAQLVD
jgi:hypothetical protein